MCHYCAVTAQQWPILIFGHSEYDSYIQVVCTYTSYIALLLHFWADHLNSFGPSLTRMDWIPLLCGQFSLLYPETSLWLSEIRDPILGEGFSFFPPGWWGLKGEATQTCWNNNLYPRTRPEPKVFKRLTFLTCKIIRKCWEKRSNKISKTFFPL